MITPVGCGLSLKKRKSIPTGGLRNFWTSTMLRCFRCSTNSESTGGRAGSHFLEMLRGVRMPVVTTLHTVLKDPSRDQRDVMAELDALSNRFIVMADRAPFAGNGVWDFGRQN